MVAAAEEEEEEEEEEKEEEEEEKEEYIEEENAIVVVVTLVTAITCLQCYIRRPLHVTYAVRPLMHTQIVADTVAYYTS